MASRFKFRRVLQIHSREGETTVRQTSRWGNKDLYPVPMEQRRFSWISYISFWAIASMSLTLWAYGGSLLAVGLTAGESIAAIIISNVFVSTFAVLCGKPGTTLHTPFNAMARVTFGLYGSYLPILVVVFENVVFFGIHSYFGGLAVCLVLGSMSSSFHYMKNTLPESAQITTQELIGYMVYIVIFLAFVFVHPSKMQRLVWPAACAVCITFFGLFGWTIAVNHGVVGHVISPAERLRGSTNIAFGILYGITSAAGSLTAFSLRMSDWTRFSKTKHAPTIALWIGPIIFGSTGAILGILATSAIYSRFHVVQWNPVALLLFIQEKYYTAGGRAATFFAGLAFFWSLVMNNLMGKILSAGIDLAGVFPRYLSVKRSGLLLVVIGVVIQPWRLVSGSSTFLTVLSAFGVFVAPLAGIVTADYYVVRRQKWKVPDLYKQDGIYWYTWGVNWRAIGAFFLSMVFSLPGFAAHVNHNHHIDIGWQRVFQMCYILNIIIGALVFCGLSWAFPPRGLGLDEAWDETESQLENDTEVVEVEGEKSEQVEELERSS